MSTPFSSHLPHLLIIDDDRDAALLLHTILKGEGTLSTADGGLAGLAMVQEKFPDLILLDADMPQISGFEVCAALKADPRLAKIPVIFVTGCADVASETRALQLGAVDFISKPFSPLVVKARVRNHLLLKQHIDSLQQLAAIDGLTGIANRRSFDEALEMEWRRAARRGEPLALMLLDVDFFKRYNDHYGHPAGDLCLRHIAQVLSTVAQRPGDLAARYGGEEFAILAPNTHLEAIYHLAEELCERVRQLQLPHERSEVAPWVTVSIGVCSVLVPGDGSTGSGRPVDSPLSLVQAADRGLYRAKQAGRNRVVVGSLLDAGSSATL
ncbi:MAG: diguanylate cyclase [Magnetococcales bacterium]|nr:diguanylate cyclase [Magnetococcales bacterium]MBF0114736.1 diguanylate cyclase [Magnetococcales bacterium]